MRTATLFNFLVESTLIGSVMILVLLALRPLVRRCTGSRLMMVAWVLVALRLLLPLALPNPAMNALKPTLSQDAGIRPMADQVRTRVEDAARSLYWKSGVPPVRCRAAWPTPPATGSFPARRCSSTARALP